MGYRGRPLPMICLRQLHSRVPVDVGEQPQAEALRVGGVGEAIHRHGRLGGVECSPTRC